MTKIIFSLFVSLFVFCVPALAEQLPKDVQTEFISDFSAGLITDVSSRKLPPNASPSMENFLIDQNLGQLQKRNGYITLGSTSTLNYVNFIFVFNKVDGTKEYLVSDGSTVLTTQDFTNYSRVRAGLNQLFNLRAVQVENKVWFSNGSDSVFTWDGSTVTVLDGQTYSGMATPNVPKGKVITYYQGRVFVGNLPGDSSSINFSAVSSTDGIAINADDSRAWPGVNQLFINSGDGQVVTGFSKLSGVLNVWKNRSVYSLQGTDEFSYFARLQNDEVGSLSQEAIVNLDNVVYTIGENDILAFDGNDYVPLSEHNRNEFQYIKKEISRTASLVWDSDDDFDGKNSYVLGFSSAGVFTLSGFDTYMAIKSTYATGQFSDIISTGFPLNGGTTIGFYVPPVINDTRYLGFISSMTLYLRQGNNPGASTMISTSFANRPENPTGGASAASSVVPALSENDITWVYTNLPLLATADDFATGKIQITVNYNSISDIQYVYPPWRTWPADNNNTSISIFMTPLTTGSYLSQISTAVGLSQWDRFNAAVTLNSGAISFYIKTSTALNLFPTIPWTPISPGALISSSQNANYVQWAATITSHRNVDPPYIDSVEITYITGNGSLTRPFAAKWGNRYHLGVSTLTTGETQLVYVKSRQIADTPKALTKFSNINARVFATDGSDLFLAGSSTAGVVFRLDYGLQDNGAVTQSYYDTPDLLLGSPYYKKDILKYFFDVESDAEMTLQVDTYIDGEYYSTRSIAIPESGRNVFALNNVNSSCTSIRLRLINSDFGKSLKVNSIGIFYLSTKRGP